MTTTPATDADLAAAARHLADIFAMDYDTSQSIGHPLACGELDALVKLLAAAGKTTAAENFLASHHDADDCDEHWELTPAAYLARLTA